MDTTKKTGKPGYEIAEADVRIHLDEELGTGGFGKVFKGTWLGDEVALKVLPARMEGEEEKEFRHELEVILGLNDCPRLVKLLGAVLEGPKQVMVMELMSGGNLHSLLRKEKDLDWDTKYRIALDVAYGIKYLHDRNILHRDLNSMNVLLNKEGRAKIGDFGLAKVKSVAKSRARTNSSGVGSLLWMAPELFNLEVRFSNASDIYALGMVLYEIMTHKTPFEIELQGRHPSIIIPHITKGDRPDMPDAGPQDYKALIESCWHQESGTRPMASDVIARLQPLWQREQASTTVSEGIQESVPDLSITDSSSSLSSLSDERLVMSEKNYLDSGYKSTDSAQAQSMSGYGIFSGAQSGLSRPSSKPSLSSEPSIIQQKQTSSPDPKLYQEKVNQFVQLVAYGKQDEAEAMLMLEHRLVLGRGHCKDHAGRKFTGITGFQYALWARDWHMWEMIRGYLDRVDPQSAAIQCQGQETLTSDQGHGAHFSFEPLIRAYYTYITQFEALYEADNRRDLNRLWVHGVGGAQRDLVAHVVQEYCHPFRSFEPMPDFTARPFPRQLDEGWWSAKINGVGLGGTLDQDPDYLFFGGGAWRTEENQPGIVFQWLSFWPVLDADAMVILCETRTSQLNDIREELLALAVPQPGV